MDWIPEIASGSFYIKDKHYYLYGKKETKVLEELKTTEFELEYIPKDLDGTLIINSKPYTNFSIEGKTLKIHHPDPIQYCIDESIVDANRFGLAYGGITWLPNDLVSFTYDYKKSTAGVISDEEETEVFYIHNGKVNYKLPCHYPPIVITDDNINISARDFTPEFKITEYSYLEFNNKFNYLLNPAFEITPIDTEFNNSPVAWTVSDPAKVFCTKLDAYYGSNVLYVEDSGTIEQTINIPAGKSTISFYGRSPKETTVELTIDDSNSTVTITGELTEEWNRIIAEFDVVGATTQISVENTGSEIAFLDAFQAELEDLSQFSYISPNSTVEYETDPIGIFTYETGEYENIADINLNPTMNYNSRGFLSIGEYVDDPHDEPLFKGGSNLKSALHSYICNQFIYIKGLQDNSMPVNYKIHREPQNEDERDNHYLKE